jgi:eukaryotic-like serine/threonine-protein kinase
MATHVPTLLRGRYELDRRLGAGGYGSVYAATDRRLGVEVALKLLHKSESLHVWRFKREFRALASLVHPNLVVLHELDCEAGSWFYTMELVDGAHLGRSTDDAATYTAPVTAWGNAPRAPRESDVMRFEAAPFAQLAEALAFIHAAGTLHCDLKPSNVLVTPTGRVVVVDFGLTTLLAADGETHDPSGAGTPSYMAPEQGGHGPLSPASDVYALGVMLFEAISGRLPFEGADAGVVQAKRELDAPRLAAVAPDVAPELDALVAAMLAREPAARPAAREVAEVLGASRAATSSVHAPRGANEREPETRRVASLLGEARSVLVVGPSGIGKTTVATAACAALVAGGAVVLRARCYERERAPFEVVDGLARSLADELDVRGLSAREDVAAALAALAPLAPSVASATQVGDAAPSIARDDALAGLEALLGVLAADGPLALWIDDLQWLDADGHDALLRVLAATRVPLLATLRDGRSRGATFAAALDGAVTIDLAPLDVAASARLLAGLPEAAIARAVREAGGNPLLLSELAEHLGRRDGDADLSLAGVVATRLEPLGAEAATMLALLGAAARPLEDALLVKATARHRGVGPAVAARALYALAGARLVRREESASDDAGAVLPRHAAIGAAALERADGAGLRGLHRALAETLADDARDEDAEATARHWVAAGEPQRATRFLMIAAERALAAFAFQRARDLADAALAIAPSARAHVLRGEALAALGHGPDAARSFSEAARTSSPERALELERRAAEQLLKSGHVAAGTRALDRVLAAVGMRRPTSRVGALASLALSRAKVRVLDPARRAPRASGDPTDARRADAAWSLSVGLAFVDPLVASDFATRHLFAAARTGERERWVRALSAEALTLGGGGDATWARVLDLQARMDALAETPRERATAVGTRGVTAAIAGRFEASFQACNDAEALYRDEVRDAPWERTTVQHFLLWSAFQTGRVDVILARAPRMFDAALARGDHYGATGLAGHYANLAWLLCDRREAARVVDACERAWQDEGFCLLRYDLAMARAHAALLDGRPHDAVAPVEAAWSGMTRAFYLHVEALRLDAALLRARVAIACAAASGVLGRARWASAAARSIVTAGRVKLPIAGASAALHWACLAGALGDRARAEARLRAALPLLDAAGLPLYAALARRAVDGTELPHGEALATIFLPGIQR